MASKWNQWLDRMLAADLTENERRLCEALARLLLGWRRNGHGLGERLIRETARLDGRSFARARASLIEKGLLAYTPGKPGRGNRSTYELVLEEKPASERAISEPGKPAPQRAKHAERKARAGGSKKPAPQRARIGIKQRKTPAAREKVPAQLLTQAFDAYTGAGGTLQLDRDRGALARNVTTLVKAGVDDRSILAACKESGSNREFPGYVAQRAKTIAADGGPCQWEALGRTNLTATQLAECACPRCAEWLAYRKTETGVTA